MKKFLLATLLSLAIAVSLAVPVFSHAQSNDLRLQIPLTDPSKSEPIEAIPLCDTDPSKPGAEVRCDGIARYVSAAYVWIIGAIGILVVLTFMYGGVLYLISAGDSGKIQQAQTAMTNALVGLILTLGSYAVLWIINPDFVQLRPITLPGLNQPELAVKLATPTPTSPEGTQQDNAPAPAVACGKSTSTATGTVSSSPITYSGSDGYVWISGALKNGDTADVIYYFHGLINQDGGASYTHVQSVIAPLLQSMIANRTIGPVILVAPKSQNGATPYDLTTNTARGLLKKVLQDKGLSVTTASESIAGHSAGGEVIAKEMSKGGNYKYVGLMDPSPWNISSGSVQKYKDHILFDYNAANWGGQSADVANHFERIRALIPERSRTGLDHYSIIKEQVSRLNSCFGL